MHRVLRSAVVHRLSRPQFQQCRSNATDATPDSTARRHITSEFNGLVIPSRQELLSRKGPLNNNSSARIQGTVTRRHDPTIEQRRAARLAREVTMTTQGQKAGPDRVPRARWQNKETGTGGQQRDRPATTKARGTNQDWHKGLDALGQSTTKTRDRRGKRTGRPTAPFNVSQRTRSRGGNRIAYSEGTTATKSLTATSSQGRNARSGEDIPFNVIEEGGEEPNGAGMMAPEGLSADLADVFGQMRPKLDLVSSLEQKRPVTSIPSPPPKDRTKYIIETFGGDYTRYSPHTGQDYLTDPKNINTMKLAQLALSKNKGIDLNQRGTLLKIVSAAATVSNKEARA
ncbi:hypothetical protein AX15_005496 [Amanita polypyramis BW_CC]|nr:hypothetical protein AX15_005496 [Amanita polypyramis BW_CC]